MYFEHNPNTAITRQEGFVFGRDCDLPSFHAYGVSWRVRVERGWPYLQIWGFTPVDRVPRFLRNSAFTVEQLLDQRDPVSFFTLNITPVALDEPTR